jgi:hypothetical protein
MSFLNSKRFIIPLVIGSLGFLTILLSELIVQTQPNKIVEVTWLASVLVTVSTFVIRFYSIDSEKFDRIITNTYPVRDQELNPQRYLNWMVIAMVIGLIATVSIHFDFIVGMLVYLLMQVALMVAFSGIISLKPSNNLNSGLRNNFLISIVFWIILIPAVYVFLVYNGPDSLIVVPYVIAIGLMACISWFGLGYHERSSLFRFMIVIASGLFVFSDTLIGNSKYGQFDINLNILIDITYVLNIFLMSHAILFLKDSSGLSPVISDE